MAEAAERAGVDQSTIMKLRVVAKQGVVDALAASRPGVKQAKADPELLAARGGDRASDASVDQRQVKPVAANAAPHSRP